MHIGFDSPEVKQAYQLEQARRHAAIVQALRRAGYAVVTSRDWSLLIVNTTHERTHP